MLALALFLASGPAHADSAQVVSDRVAVGLHTDGSLVMDDRSLGLLWDPDGKGPEPLGSDYLLAGRAFGVWFLDYRADGDREGATCGGDEADCGEEVAWDAPVTTASVAYVHGTLALPGLAVDLWVEAPLGEDQVWITYALVPDGALIEEVELGIVIDPDQESAAYGTYNTDNASDDNWAVGGPIYGDRAVALAVTDGVGGVCSWCTDGDGLYDGAGDAIEADRQIGVVVAPGDLPDVGAAVTFAIGFGTDIDTAVGVATAAAEDPDHDRDGATVLDGDCDDRDPDRSPFLPEVVDGVDNDCDDAIDEDTAVSDDDGDGYTEGDGDCDDADPEVYPGAPPVDGVADADCDGLADETDDTGILDTGLDTGDPMDTDTDTPPGTDTDPQDTGATDTGGDVKLSGAGCAGCAAGAVPGGTAALWPLAAALVGLMRRRRAFALAAVALVGCAEKPQDTGATGPETTDPGTTPDPTGETSDTDPPVGDAAIAIAVHGAPVLDPKLDGAAVAVDVTLASGTGCAVEVEARTAAGLTRVVASPDLATGGSAEVGWDGLMDDGLPADVGAVALVATATCADGTASATADVHVVRLGVVAVDLTGPEEGDGGHVPLAYHTRDLLTRDVQVLQGMPEYLNDRTHELQLADLDDDTGVPREATSPWLDPRFPPWGTGEAGEPGLGRHNVPAGYVAGSVPTAVVTPGTGAVSARTHVPSLAIGDGAPAIRLASPDLAEPVAWVPGEPARAAFAAPLPDELGRRIVDLTWQWEAETADGWAPIAGQAVTSHELYLLLDAPVLVDREDIGSPAVPWIGVLADVDPAITGLPRDTFAVMDALRNHVHYDDHVEYNPSDGAYSDYEGPYIYWDSIFFQMSDWLDRADGIDLYCHSVACLLSSLAGTVGADAPYQTFTGAGGAGFRTNLTRAAGDDDWLSWSFNSHGVTGVWEADELYIWDASVSLDGDAEPWAQPVSEVSVLGFPIDDYFDNVSENALEIQNTGYCFLL